MTPLSLPAYRESNMNQQVDGSSWATQLPTP
jgi:hypothetical protein